MNRPEPPVFLFTANWAYSNLGCEAIVRGTTALLRQTAGEGIFISQYFSEPVCDDAVQESDPQIIHSPFPILKRYSPAWIEDQVGRRWLHQPVSRPVLKALHHSLKEADAALLLGGDTFTTDYGQSDFYFRLSREIADQHVPFTLWGASIGPFSADPSYEKKAVSQLRRIDLICVRETESLAYLDSLGVRDNVLLSADPSFYLEPSACPLPAEIEKVLSQGCIGINLSPLLRRYLSAGDAQVSQMERLNQWKQVAAEVIRRVIRRFSQPVLLIPHVFSMCEDVYRDDYLFLKEVMSAVDEPQAVRVLPPGFNAAQTKWIISQTQLFAGARTHSTFAAISSCVPTICIGYSLKAQGIAKDVYGNLNWLLPGQDLVADPGSLTDRLVTLKANEAQVRQQIAQRNPVFQDRAQQGILSFLEMASIKPTRLAERAFAPEKLLR